MGEVRQDQEPGFWCEWRAPSTAVAEAMQFPWAAQSWPDRVTTAYLKDCRHARNVPAAQRASKEGREDG